MTHRAAAFLLSRPQHGPMSKLRGLLLWLICLICLGSALPITGWAQTNAPAPLPPAAQQALDKGIIAAKVPDYPLAIRFFEEARKLAPKAPVIYLNLGIAESKIPGRELRAIAWFGAYLAASPDAPNAAAVKEQMVVLDVRHQSNVSRFLQTVQSAADLVRANVGLVMMDLARVQIEAGDIQGARNNLITARKAADHMQREERIWSAHLRRIAQVQIEAGDVSGAQITLASAQKTADRMREDPLYKAPEQYDIAEAQIAVGDIAGAQNSLASAQKTTDLIKDPRMKSAYQFKGRNIQGWIDAARVKSTPQSPSGAQPPIQPVMTVSDWLKALDDDNEKNDCPLGARPFLDLAGYLKSLPPSDDPREVFIGLYKPAKKIVTAQNVIHRMLKQQAIR